MKTNRSNKLFDQTRIATLGLQDLLAFGQLQPDGTYKVRNVTNSNFLNAIVISEQITYAEILALATAGELVVGKNYTITNAVSGTLSLYIFAVSTSKLAEYGYDTTTGQVYSYDLATDTATNADNTGYINFTPQTAPAYQRGRVWYDSTTETLSVYDDISGTSVQLGQEEILRARNSTGSTILNGAVVYVSGAQGQNPRVSLALANAESTSRVIGVATHNISNNSVGKITTFGIVGDLNTSAYNEGDVLYLSASVAGGLTTTRPSAPNQAVMVGTVIHAAVNDGKILVHTDNYGVGFGTANQVRGMNAAGTAEEYKTIQGTASEVEVLHTANTVTIGLPNAVTISGAMTAGSFVKSGGVSAQFLKADGTVDANAYFYTNAQVTGQALTGLSVSGSAVVSTDSILTGIGKLQNQINAVLGSVNFQGVWNASTNSPSLASGVGTKGYYYVVSVPGSTNLDGITDWKLGDWAIYDGTAWQKVDNTDAVVSVNGYTGIVTLAKADIGLGNVENTALSTWAGSGNITTLGTIGTGVWQGTAIGDTYISSASTWNAKIGGSGTTGYIPKFTASGTIGDSVMVQNGNNIGINTLSAGYPLHIVRGDAGVGLQVENSTTYSHIRLQSNGTNQNSYLTFNATGTGSAIIQINDADKIEINSNGDVKLITTPTTSAGTFDLITRNTSTGVLEKVASSYYATAGSISGTAGRLAKFTSSGAVGDSIVSESGGAITIAGSLVASNGTFSGLGASATIPTLELSQGASPYAHITGAGGSSHGIILRGVPLNGSVTDFSVTPSDVVSFYEFGGEFRFYQKNGTLTELMKLTPTQLTTFGATGSEAHIFGGSARVNGALLNTTQATFATVSGIVGIGTASPSVGMLHLNYNSVNNRALRLQDENGIYDIITSGGGNNHSLGIYDETNSAYRVYITPSGNVGIGTTSPLYKLDVNGTLGVSGAATFSSSVGAETLTLKKTGVSALYLYRDLDVGVVGTAGQLVEFGARNGSNFISGAAIGGALESGGTIGNLVFQTLTAGSLTTKLTIASTGAATFSSSVTAGGQVTTTSTTGYQLISGGNTLFSLGYSGGTLLNRITGTSLFLAENGTPQLTIASGGAATFSSSVSIGTSSSFGKLLVRDSEPTFGLIAGISNNNGGTSTTGSKLLFDASGVGAMWIGMPSSTNAFSVGLYNGTTNPEYMRIKSSGVINMSSLPTSSAGLSAGDIWNDSGTLKIV